MKNSNLITFLFCLLGFNGIAQNYNCLQHGPIHYFTNGDGYLRGIRIDSVRTSGADTLYYPYRTARGSSCWSLNCDGSSWLGKRVIQQADGTFLFDNMWNDTVVIKTQAIPGDTWMFFKDTTQIWYTATLTAVDTMTIYGSIDSVKTITISAYSNGTLNPSDSVNDFKLKLSKHHGFVQVFDLFTFPYHHPGLLTGGPPSFDYYLDLVTGELSGTVCGGMYVYNTRVTQGNSIFRLTSIHNPSLMEVYDTNAGDMFEYTSSEIYDWASATHLSLDSIVAKTTTPYSVTLQRKQKSKTTTGAGVTSYWEGLSSSTYDTSKFFNLSRLPEEVGQGQAYYYLPDAEMITPCRAPIYGRQTIYIDFSLCQVETQYWLSYYYKIGHSSETYAGGYGQTSSLYQDYTGPGMERNLQLIYAFKDGVSCGIYHPVGIQEVTLSLETSIGLYPNPTQDVLTVSATVPVTSIAITDVHGRILHDEQYYSRNVVLNTANYPAGMYFVKVNGIAVQKFIKQ